MCPPWKQLQTRAMLLPLLLESQWCVVAKATAGAVTRPLSGAMGQSTRCQFRDCKQSFNCYCRRRWILQVESDQNTQLICSSPALIRERALRHTGPLSLGKTKACKIVSAVADGLDGASLTRSPEDLRSPKRKLVHQNSVLVHQKGLQDHQHDADVEPSVLFTKRAWLGQVR